MRDRSDASHASGFGDLGLALKWRPLGHAPWIGDFALLPALKLPTGSRSRGTGTGTTDASAVLISSEAFGLVWSMRVQVDDCSEQGTSLSS